MTPGRPGDGGPYRDPYGQDPYGEDPLGQDPYGQDPYGQEAHGRDAYGQEAHGQGAYGQGAYGQESYGQEASYGEDPYGVRGAGQGGQGYGQSYDAYGYLQERPGGDYRSTVDALSDPLTDPLPSAGTPDTGRREENTSPWFRSAGDQGAGHEGQPAAGQPFPQQQGYPQQYAAPQTPQRPQPQPHQQPQQPQPQPQPQPPVARRGPADVGETAAMPALGALGAPADAPDEAAAGPAATAAEPADDERRTVALRRPSEEELGGRAARRRAAAGKGRGGRRAAGGAPQTPARPMTRLEARRAARAAKDGPVVLLSRAIGEVFITCGVLMLLFVAYQLWWTNVLADNYAGGAKESLTQKWANNPERKPGEFSPGQGFAIMYIPKLDVVVPVAQGIDKQSVLDNGLVGHYDKASGLPTAMPWDKKGNFGVAGHRNTHGEPFRYINRLVAGDKIIVETAEKYYIYEMYSRLPSTSPSNVSVLEPVPPQSGFEKPGRYITLTTCTPEFTSKYRLIVWGRMVDERPRSEGKPDALVE